jgi:serine/threonine protein kinase/WD40 repeat protein
MLVESVPQLVEEIGRLDLLAPEQVRELPSLQAGFPDPRALARELLRREWLTAFQANRLLQGRGQELLLGSYVLLEQVGSGGMGEVFKARNRKLGRVAALKVIRRERLADDAAVRRFHREIRAAAQLTHPNIVLAYDADQVGGTHFFVMEFVEGQDLGRLIKQRGPLPVATACDCVRQAALGLQHAHERGLVHRDIKPHNLLLTRHGVVKVLDLGLARLNATAEGEASTTVTHEGMVMGTPDYMAPEQAEESHAVDIRADLYSLGCTLYYLLSGQVPFPGGSLLQKLRRHQSEEPMPIEYLRPDVPAAVAAVVRTLMAKRPEDRYQTPAELAAALNPDRGSPEAASMLVGDGEARADTVRPEQETQTESFASLIPPAEEPRRAARRPRRAPWRLLLVSTGLLALPALVVILYLAWGRSASPSVPPSTGPRPFEPRAVLTGHTAPVVALAYAPEGSTLASASQDRTIRLWKLTGGPCLATLEGAGAVRVLAFSPDGQSLVSAGGEPSLHIWDPVTFRERSRLVTSHPTVVRDLVFVLPTSDQLFTVGDENLKAWWSLAEQKQIGGRYLPAAGWSLAFSPGSEHFAVGLGNGTVRLCKHHSLEEHDLAGHQGPVKVLAFAPDGKLLASGGADGVVNLWDTDLAAKRTVLDAHAGAIESLSFSPDGKVLATAAADGTVRVWDVAGGKEKAVLPRHGGGSGAVAFSRDGRTLASGAADGAVR